MRTLALASLLILGLAGTALAECDVELAFSPDTAAAGDQVTLFASIANLGDEDAVADIELSVSFMDYEFGPFMAQMPLAAGEELSHEMMFMVPALPMAGTLSITVTATCNGMSDTATATLTVEAAEGATGFDGLGVIGPELISSFGGEPTSDEDATFGELKAMYR